MLTLKINVGVFSGTFKTKTRMLKLDIHIDNELLYCGMENQTLLLFFPLFVHFSVFYS